jgi:hypothetical protein
MLWKNLDGNIYDDEENESDYIDVDERMLNNKISDICDHVDYGKPKKKVKRENR